MTPIFFIAGFSLGLILTLVRNPIYGIYTYLFTFYLAPSDAWWSDSVPDLRYLFIAAAVTILAVSWLPTDTARESWYKTTPGRLLILFVLYNWMQILWAISPDAQLEAAILFTKHLMIFYLMYRLFNSLDRIRDFAVVHVIGCAWFGYLALGTKGGRLETIGGAVAESNELGVHMATGLIFGGVLLLVLRGVRRWLVFAALPLAANTLVLTVSRGSFVGFLSAGLAGLIFVPKRLRKGYMLLGALGIVLIMLLAHDQLIERFTETYTAMTTDEKEVDRSAVSRIDIAKAGIIIGMAHPFGAGSRATEMLSAPYVPGWDHGRSAHNNLLEAFAEHGFPGLLLYVLTMLWVLRTLWRLRKSSILDDSGPQELNAFATMAGISLLAIYVSGNFTSNLVMETQYWLLAIMASASELLKKLPPEPEAATYARDSSAKRQGNITESD